MSVVEDTRRILQDFLAPELRELALRVENLEKRMDARFTELEKRMDAGFTELEKRMDARFIELEKRTDAKFEASERLASERHTQVLQAIARLADIYELKERIARIEAREKSS